MKPWESPPAIVREITDEETQLVTEAKTALSSCHFTVGRCAQQWTERYALGRTDAAFGEMIGMSPDMVQKCRRVHELFGELSQNLELSWSHYSVAITWEDAEECLTWADENAASIAEMKAWRRAMRGEDLTADEDEQEEVTEEETERDDSDGESDESQGAPVAGSGNQGGSQTTTVNSSTDSSGSGSPVEPPPVSSTPEKPLLQQLMELLTRIEETADDTDRRKIALVLREWSNLIKPEKKTRKKTAFTPPTLAEVAEYCKERNNGVDAKRFYDYYSEAEWKDQEGKPVKNWKQKIIAVWEKKLDGKPDSGRNRDAFDEVFG